MFDPTVMIWNGRWAYVTRHEGCDYLTPSPWRVRLNPLRLELGLFRRPSGPARLVINRGGKAQRWGSNFCWWAWRRRKVERIRAAQLDERRRNEAAALASFEEDHSPTKRHSGRGHRSIPHSYGGESRNFVD